MGKRVVCFAHGKDFKIVIFMAAALMRIIGWAVDLMGDVSSKRQADVEQVILKLEIKNFERKFNAEFTALNSTATQLLHDFDRAVRISMYICDGRDCQNENVALDKKQSHRTKQDKCKTACWSRSACAGKTRPKTREEARSRPVSSCS